MSSADTSPQSDGPPADQAAAWTVDETIRAIPPSRVLEGEDESESRRLSAMTAASHLLETLTLIYGIDEWDWELFEATYLRGALGAWRPGTSVRYRGSNVEVSSPTCPLLEAAETDPALCDRCQAVHKRAAYEAAPILVRSVEVPERITDGDPQCRFTFRLRPESGHTDAPVVLDALGERLGVLASRGGTDRTFRILLDPEPRRSAPDTAWLEVAQRCVIAVRRDRIVVDATLPELLSRASERANQADLPLAQAIPDQPGTR